jgi:hypothetical protein
VANLDPIGAYIANLHNLLGHDKTALVLGSPAGEKPDCILCRHDQGLATREEVITALAAEEAVSDG